MKRRTVTPAEQRFWSKIKKTRGCWIWTASKKPGGYGQFGVGGTTRSAHRIAWELVKGRAPGPYLCHACNNPPCVRPDPRHVYEGSAKDNARDMIFAGTRWGHGTRLSDDQCREARRLYLQDETLSAAEIARRFLVSTVSVANALTGRTHRHIVTPRPIHLWNGARRNGRTRINRDDARLVRNVAYTTNKHGRTIAWREVKYGNGERCWLKFPLALANEMAKADEVNIVDKDRRSA